MGRALYRVAGWKSGAVLMKASTVVGWHRKGFRLFWTWKIRRGKQGRPAVPKEVRELIRTMSLDNPLGGAPRIYGELLKVGIDIGETSVSQYMVHRRKPPSQTWRTFLDNHVKSMVSLLRCADGSVPGPIRVSGAGARAPADRAFRSDSASDVRSGVFKQLREAFPWDAAPRYLLRDRDRIFGADFADQVKAMGIQQALGPAVTLGVCLSNGDRHSTRVPGSYDRIQRALFVATPSKLRQRLSSKPNAFGIGERQPGAPTDPTARCGRIIAIPEVGSIIVTTGAPPELLPRQGVLGCYLISTAAVCLCPTAPSLQANLVTHYSAALVLR